MLPRHQQTDAEKKEKSAAESRPKNSIYVMNVIGNGMKEGMHCP
jgi:hypothetical protein